MLALFYFRVFISSARMTPVRMNYEHYYLLGTVVVLAFFMPKKLCAFGIYFKKGGNRMKRRTHRHSRKRASRPAVVKQQIMRKEAQKLAKYPLKPVYAHPIRIKVQKRGA